MTGILKLKREHVLYMQVKHSALKIVLVIGALFYLFGAVVHFFGLSIFPFYDNNLYSPYHDTLLALASFFIALFILTVARDPLKNKDTLIIIIVGIFIASLASILIPLKINFAELGAPAKETQTIVEGVLGLLYAGLLLWLYPRKK